MSKNDKRMCLVLVGIFLAAAAFGSHFNPYGDSVDGSEIRWGGSTSFSSAQSWANSEWNAVGSISILADTIWTIEDLTWDDVNDSSASWDGRWTSRVGADLIELNAYYLNGYSTNNRRTVATHELGHALGLGDHTLSDYGSSSIIMYHCSTCSGVTTPQSHDESDYNTLW